MKNNFFVWLGSKYKKKFLLYLILIIPIIFLSSEILLGFLTFLRGKDLAVPRFGAQKVDLINGWRRRNQEINNTEYIDKNGLVKTSYFVEEGFKNENVGVIISGNSVALGVPVIYQNYKDTFVSKLEESLRSENNQVDFINLSNNGYNSWQELVEVSRYLNSSPTKPELPKLEIIASLGGIQDFWDFLDLLNMKNFPMEDYYKANGLMSWSFRNSEFLENINQSQEGNIFSSLKIFINSAIIRIRRDSNLFVYLKYFKNKYIDKKVFLENLESEKSYFEIDSNVELEQLLKNKFKIIINNYLKIKDDVISSKVRNIRLLSSLNPSGKILFVYLPTMINQNVNSTSKFIGFPELEKLGLSIKDLNVLEKSYRTDLINNLQAIENLKVYDLTKFGNSDWFYDLSHFSKKGQSEIHDLLLPVFSKALFVEKSLIIGIN